MHTVCVEMKLLLSPLSIKRLLGSEEGGGDQQMMPELLRVTVVVCIRVCVCVCVSVRYHTSSYITCLYVSSEVS